MRGEADLLDGKIDCDGFVVLHAGNAVSLLQIASDAALRTVASNADAVLWVVAPSFQQCSGLSILEHSWSAHDDHRIVLLTINPSVLLEVMDVSVLEGIRLFFVEPFSNLLAEHVDVGLIDVPALINQRNRIVDLYIVELICLLLPVLIQNKQKLLCSAGRKNR